MLLNDIEKKGGNFLMANKPTVFGNYQLLDVLANGTYGRVYRGELISPPHTIVAIKVMHSASISSVEERDKFLQEARFLKLLKHPYILPILDVGVESGVPYIVTEYASNGSLQDRLRKTGPRPLPMGEAKTILSQVGQALQFAHQQNVVHRDLKPANILFNVRGEALLADFGVATILATSMKLGTVIGTPHYMSPELFRGTNSKEGDQYALGCIAYELFTGRPPFKANDFIALAFK